MSEAASFGAGVLAGFCGGWWLAALFMRMTR